MSQYEELEKGEFTLHSLCESCYYFGWYDIFYLNLNKLVL